MKRRILIITNPGKIGASNYCQGVIKDKENYVSFFTSACGGYFSSSEEIRVLEKPSKVILQRELLALTLDSIEFSIIVFCGHGWYSTRSESNILCLNDMGEEIDSLDLRVNYNKRIIIEDCCREKHDEYIAESLIKAFSGVRLYDSGGKILNPEECKRYYNKTIEECSKQLICTMACDIDETAGDDSRTGGYYSASLLKETESMVESALQSVNLSEKYRVFNFPSCHMGAVPRVQRKSGNKQNPQIDKPRFSDEKSYLPFAIIA